MGEPEDMKIRFLGTGTSVGIPVIGCRCSVCQSRDSRNRRTRSAVAISQKGSTLVIDTPPEFRLQALQAGLDRVDAVIYTHLHADHIFGFDDLRRFNQIQGATLPIYGDRATIEGIRRIFRYAFEPPQQEGVSKPAVTVHVVEETFQAAGLTVTPVPIMHGTLTIHGYRIDGFAYLTDCSAIPASSLRLLAGVDTLVLGALRPTPHPTHFSIPEALEAIAQIRPRRAFLTHISHEVDHAAMEAALPPNVFLAYDGLQLEL